MLLRIASALIYLLVRLFHITYRFRFDGQPGGVGPKGHEHSILAIWHQNLFAGILAQTGRRHVVIVSRSSDGEPVSFLCERLGHTACRGSSRKGHVDKGGREAKDEMIAAMKGGLPGAVTVDGPRGPAFEVKPGIVDMARQTGLPIVPYVVVPKRYWTFSSWDQFRLPKPFTTINVTYGEPIFVAPDIAFDHFSDIQQQVADALNATEEKLTSRIA